MSLSSSKMACTACRSRKVKCDRSRPCSRCQYLGVECVFPQWTRKPRGLRGGMEKKTQELFARLELLESIVVSLPSNAVQDRPELPTPFDRCSPTATQPSAGCPSEAQSSYPSKPPPRPLPQSLPRHLPHPLPQHPPHLWTQSLLSTYLENVDTIFKVVHQPTLEMYLNAIFCGGQSFDAGVHALLFATYYAAVVTLTSQQCVTQFQAPQSHLLRKHKVATEIFLAKADFLNSDSLVSLQAFVIYIVSSATCPP